MPQRLHRHISSLLIAACIATSQAHAGSLTINNVGSVSDASVLNGINTAISSIESLYNTGNGAGDVTLNVNFTYTGAGAGNLASSSQYYYGYSYTEYTNALSANALANPGNINLATAVSHLADGNVAPMAITYGQALLLSQYGLSAPTFYGNSSVNINSNVTNWNFNGTASSSQYDGIGAIQHELNELLGIGGGGSSLDKCSNGNFFCGRLGSTDLLRYSGAGTPSTSTGGTYLSIDGGTTKLVDFNGVSGGDFGDFAPNCGPTPNNSGNNQYIQNAFNCYGKDEAYTTASPEFVAATAVGWNSSQQSAVPIPPSLYLLGAGLIILTEVQRRRFAGQSLHNPAC